MFDSHKLKFKQLAPFYANAKQVKCVAIDSVAVSLRQKKKVVWNMTP